MGEAGPEAGRGHRRRGACRGSPQVVELGEVGGEGCILEPAAVEPGVEAAERPGAGRADGPPARVWGFWSLDGTDGRPALRPSAPSIYPSGTTGRSGCTGNPNESGHEIGLRVPG